MGWHAAPRMLGLGMSLSCAEPTAIDVTVHSEVPCSAQAEVALSVASDPASLVGAAPAAVATTCDDLGDGTFSRGTVVLVPQGDKEKAIALQVTTRNDALPLDSCATSPTGCIVARRQLRFEPNKTIDLRLDMRLSCLNIACPLDQTCVSGRCLPSSQLQPCESCGDAGGEAGDATVPPTQRFPKVHRVMATACNPMRPPGITDAGPDASLGFGISCLTDLDCTMGQDGRCLPRVGMIAGTACTYDLCLLDMDCPPGGTCDCEPRGNQCGSSSCRTDSDCNHLGCSPSTLGCVGITQFDCHTLQDECIDDTDCATAEACQYTATVGHWVCVMPPFCPG